MKIINKLTLRHLKENKKRTVMTVIGIIVSVAMLTATCVSVTSFADMMARDELYSAGDWQANVENATAEQIEVLEKNDDLKYVAAYKALDGELYSFNLHNEKRASAGIGDIAAGNRDYFSAFVTGEFIGMFPKDETEITVTRSLLTKNGLDWEIGDKVTVDLGKRYITDENGEQQLTANAYTVGETFESTGKKVFTVVGIIEKNSPTRGVDILRGLGQEEADGAKVYLTANTLDRGTEELLTNAVKSAGIDQKQMSVHRELFRYNWIVRDTDNTMQVLINFALILVVIIIFASVMLIYNAFSISISERSRYLGMLASVGATKAQKRRSVYFESAVLGLIGIPLGFGAGLLGIGITFKAISPLLQKSVLNDVPFELRLSFPWWILPIIAALGIVTLIISAYVPARRASRTTPIDALRQTNDVKVKSRKLKVPKIVRTVFGYEGELAYKNLKRNGKKSRVITSALVLSVVLFLSVNTFCSMFQEANKTTESIPYQITVAYPDTEKDRLYKDMQQIDDINRFYSTLNQFFYDVHFSEQHYKSAYRDKYAKKGVTVSMNILDDADFNALCTENKIDYKLFYEKTNDLPILILNSDGRSENSPAIFEDSLVGTALPLAGGDISLYKLTVRGLIRYHNSDLSAYNLTSSVIIAAYAPYSAVKENPAFKDTYSMGFLGIETDTAAVAEAVQSLLESGNYQNSYVTNLQEQTEAMNATITVMQVFIYGFIALITMIAVVNIFNTVSTGIDLRRKEFAMLKSVGITPRGFRKMLRFESLFYGLKALFYGLPISLGVSVVMWKALTEGFEIPFHPDWRIYLGVTVAVFFITGISMTYATAKVKKDSIIETLKSEIN